MGGGSCGRSCHAREEEGLVHQLEGGLDLCQRIREAISTEISQKRSLFEAYVSSVCAISFALSNKDDMTIMLYAGDIYKCGWNSPRPVEFVWVVVEDLSKGCSRL